MQAAIILSNQINTSPDNLRSVLFSFMLIQISSDRSKYKLTDLIYIFNYIFSIIYTMITKVE